MSTGNLSTTIRVGLVIPKHSPDPGSPSVWGSASAFSAASAGAGTTGEPTGTATEWCTTTMATSPTIDPMAITIISITDQRADLRATHPSAVIPAASIMAASQAHIRHAARLAAVSMVAGIPTGAAAFMGVEAAPMAAAAAFMGVEAAPMAEVTVERPALMARAPRRHCRGACRDAPLFGGRRIDDGRHA